MLATLVRNLRWLIPPSVLLAFSCGAAAATQNLEQEIAARLDQLRAIRAGQSSQTIESYNKQTDQVWEFLGSHKPQVLPILREQLKAEMARSQPSDFLLLDIGLFLHQNDPGAGEALARDALFRLNAQAPVMKENLKELFELTHAVAEDRDPRVLALIDRVFLPSNEKIFIPQHALNLDGTLVCVFLYGVYGPDAERALNAHLHDRALARRVVEILAWLGSPDSVPKVADALAASSDYDTFARVTSFMMQAAGPAGRKFMLEVPTQNLDTKSRDYLAKIHSAVSSISLQQIEASLPRSPGDARLSDAEVKSRLTAMIARFGQDDRTNPMAILNSGLSSDFLIGQLLQVRRRTLYRLSDEALSDVEITNILINGLRYRGQ